MADVLEPSSGEPVPEPTRTPWRESALTRAAELRGRLMEFLATAPRDRGAAEIAAEVLAHVVAAEQAASGKGSWPPRRWIASVWGASVERAISHLDAAELALLRLAPASYVVGQLPAILARARAHLPADDPRLQRLARLAELYAETTGSARHPAGSPGVADPCAVTLCQVDREAVVAALRAATLEERREVTRVRSFRNVLLSAAMALTLCAGGVLVVGIVRPDAIPLCFTPVETAVCPTHTGPSPEKRAQALAEAARAVRAPPAPSTTTNLTPGGGLTNAQEAAQAEALDRLMRYTASRWDIAIVELIGLVAAAVAAATSLRKLGGTSTPYSLPTALAVVKLPTGALTAVLGLVLIRGAFVPGLSALDTSGQILAWAVVFGYAQQVFTRFVDDKARGVLDEIGTVDRGKAQGVTVRADAPPSAP
jgi:hypothetical protein